MCLLVATLFIPFDRPFEVDIRLDAPPPLWLATSAGMLLATLLMPLAAIGLFLFRRWGRRLGAFVFVLGALLVWPISRSPMVESMGTRLWLCWAVVALAWLATMLLSYFPALSARFEPQRAPHA